MLHFSLILLMEEIRRSPVEVGSLSHYLLYRVPLSVLQDSFHQQSPHAFWRSSKESVSFMSFSPKQHHTISQEHSIKIGPKLVPFRQNIDFPPYQHGTHCPSVTSPEPALLFTLFASPNLSMELHQRPGKNAELHVPFDSQLIKDKISNRNPNHQLWLW